MNVIVGLGNPGKHYERTRHNAGFHVIDELSRRTGTPMGKTLGRSLTGVATIGGARVLLAKPLTYMNESGVAVAALLRACYATAADLIVIHDDLDLPPGTVRVKVGGGHGGHNGLRSIIERCGTADFVRVRVGIGRPPAGEDAADYVLRPFSADERQGAADAAGAAADAVVTVLEQGVVTAMNRFNRKA